MSLYTQKKLIFWEGGAEDCDIPLKGELFIRILIKFLQSNNFK